MDNNSNINNINKDCLIIEGDDHVLFLEKRTTLKVGTFKNNIKQELPKIIENFIALKTIKIADCDSISGEFDKIVWNSPPKNCEVLLLGKDSWQNGKLNTRVCLDFFDYIHIDDNNRINLTENQVFYETGARTKYYRYIHIYNYQIILEFFPEQLEIQASIENESFLDDIRQSISYR